MEKPTTVKRLTVSDLKNITLPLSLETYEQLKATLRIRNESVNWTKLSPELKKAYGEMNKQEAMDLHTEHSSRFD